MVQSQPNAEPRPFTGRHMLIIIVAFFGVVIAVNITMAVISSRTWTGLVVENSYVASQEYQDKLDAHRAQAAAGWESTLGYDGRSIRLDIVANGEPVVIDALTVRLNRPIGTSDDRILQLALQPDGSYSAETVLGDGMWEALVSAPSTVFGPYELHKRFKVGEGQ